VEHGTTGLQDYGTTGLRDDGLRDSGTTGPRTTAPGNSQSQTPINREQVANSRLRSRRRSRLVRISQMEQKCLGESAQKQAKMRSGAVAGGELRNLPKGKLVSSQ